MRVFLNELFSDKYGNFPDVYRNVILAHWEELES